jgi:beta-glucosidase
VKWARDNANALLQAWYPGEEGGKAIAETLAGASNPAGRLPVTFYASTDQLPDFADYSMKERTYRYFTGQPLFGFGFGLSYSRFEYTNLTLSSRTVQAGQPLQVRVRVKNAGEQDGDEVVQLYLSIPGAAGAPRRALRAFKRVHLRHGDSQVVQLSLAPRELSHVDANGAHVISAGRYDISVGGGQPDSGLAAVKQSFVMDGQQQLPR